MQIWVLDKDPYKAVEFLTNRLVNKMLVEQLQLLSTFYRGKGICYDFMYKSIPQGKELVYFIEHNLDWNLQYLDALVKENFKRFGERARIYKSVEVANKFLTMFKYSQPKTSNKSTPLSHISFRCKKEYNLYGKLNKKELPVEEGIEEYRKYYKWNTTKMLNNFKITQSDNTFKLTFFRKSKSLSILEIFDNLGDLLVGESSKGDFVEVTVYSESYASLANLMLQYNLYLENMGELSKCLRV